MGGVLGRVALLLGGLWVRVLGRAMERGRKLGGRVPVKERLRWGICRLKRMGMGEVSMLESRTMMATAPGERMRHGCIVEVLMMK